MSAEMPPESINPYASPQEYTAEAEEALRRQTPYGLAQPIRAVGTLTPGELREGVRRAAGLDSKQARRAILFVLACFVFLAWRTAMPWLLILVAVAVSFRALTGLTCRWRMQWSRDACRYPREFLFSETEVGIASTTFQETIPWEGFGHCTVSDTIVALHFMWGMILIVPQSFVTSAGDWERLTALVRHKLPEKPTPQPPRPEAVLPAWGDTLGAFCGQGHFGYQDVLVIHHVTGERGRVWQGAAVAFAPLPVPLLIAAATTGVHVADGMALFVAMAFYGWLLFLAPRQMARKKIRRREGLFGRLLMAVSEEGLAVRSVHLDARILWGNYAGYRLLPDHLFLFQDSRPDGMLLPRSFFSETDWPKVVELVQRKLPRI